MISPSAVNIEPVICNGHLPYPWGQHWREGRVGSWMQGVGISKAKHLGEGRGGSENFVFTSWLIGAFDHGGWDLTVVGSIHM